MGFLRSGSAGPLVASAEALHPGHRDLAFLLGLEETQVCRSLKPKRKAVQMIQLETCGSFHTNNTCHNAYNLRLVLPANTSAQSFSPAESENKGNIGNNDPAGSSFVVLSWPVDSCHPTIPITMASKTPHAHRCHSQLLLPTRPLRVPKHTELSLRGSFMLLLP